MDVPLRPRVLVVDDHTGLAERLRDIVERAGFRASCAFGGSEAIAAFSAALSEGAPFSAVVTDFSMGDVDGRVVAAAVKAASQATPVVMLTAYAIDIDDDLPENVDALLVKPPSDEQLRSTLARLLIKGR